MDEFVDRARLADELAATAEIRAAMFRVHAREAAVSARMTGSAEARLLYESLCEQREQAAQLLSQAASYLRRTARLLGGGVESSVRQGPARRA